jgi:hypothetical protein
MLSFFVMHSLAAPSPSQIQSLVNDAIKGGEPRFVVPPGEYPFNASNFVVSSASSFELDASGAKFLFNPGSGIAVEHSRSTTIRGLSMDYKPPCFSQGRIVKVQPPSSNTLGSIDFEVDDGFLHPDPAVHPIFGSAEVKVIYWNNHTRLIKKQAGANPWDPSRSKSLGGSMYRVGLGNQWATGMGPEIGDLVTLSPRSVDVLFLNS